MASAVLSCCGLISSRLAQKAKDRKERESEYSQNFEVLREENAKRVRHLSDLGVEGYEKFAEEYRRMEAEAEAEAAAAAAAGETGASPELSGARGTSLESSNSGTRLRRMETVNESGETLGEGRLGEGNGVGLVRGLPSYDEVISTSARSSVSRRTTSSRSSGR